MSDTLHRALLGIAIASLLGSTTTETAQEANTVEAHRAAARTAAGDDHGALLDTVCRVPRPLQTGRPNTPRPPRQVPPIEEWYVEPAQVFDNLYFVGTREHGAWAVTTSEGIIVIDRALRVRRRSGSRRRAQNTGARPRGHHTCRDPSWPR